MLISFVGLMGSGKTTVGRALARKLELDFYDSDQIIERHLGCSIRSYFEEKGEASFRDLEQAAIEELTLRRRAILSTGGGACLRRANREHLNTRSYCIYLQATPQELYRRLSQDSSRPLLQVADPLAKLQELYAIRHPLYLETAHQVFKSTQPSMVNLVHLIHHHLERSCVI